MIDGQMKLDQWRQDIFMYLLHSKRHRKNPSFQGMRCFSSAAPRKSPRGEGGGDGEHDVWRRGERQRGGRGGGGGEEVGGRGSKAGGMTGSDCWRWLVWAGEAFGGEREIWGGCVTEIRDYCLNLIPTWDRFSTDDF